MHMGRVILLDSCGFMLSVGKCLPLQRLPFSAICFALFFAGTSSHRSGYMVYAADGNDVESWCTYGLDVSVGVYFWVSFL
jgi:hypothetical protein